MDELVREALQEGRLTVAGGGPVHALGRRL